VRHAAFLKSAATARYGGDERSVRVGEGESVRQKPFLLMPRGVIAGQVMVDGKPAVNAMVTIERVAEVGGQRKLVPFGNAYTNDLGEYRLFNVSPGRYYVSAGYHADRGENSAAGEAPVFYPGAGALSEAVAVGVRAGSQQLGVNLMLSHTRAWTVRGRVSSERGVTGDVQVELAALDPVLTSKLGGQNVVTMRDGSFVIPNVLPGEYVLRAVGRGTDGTLTGRTAVHVARGDLNGAAVRLAPAMRVQGRVETEGDGKCRYGELHVMLQALGDANVAPLRAAVMENGEFTMESVAPESYRLSVEGARGGCYLKAIAVGGKNADNGVVTLLQAGQEIHMTMSSRGAAISGVVLDENQQAVRAATVLLVADADSEQKEPSRRVAGDAAGAFSIEGIAPGRYVLFALAEGAEGANEDEAAPQGRGVAVSVREADRKQLQLRVQSAADR
jgi:hypothetical protein